MKATGRGEIRQISWLQMSQRKGNVRQKQDDLYMTISNIDYTHFSLELDIAATTKFTPLDSKLSRRNEKMRDLIWNTKVPFKRVRKGKCRLHSIRKKVHVHRGWKNFLLFKPLCGAIAKGSSNDASITFDMSMHV
jgi:hypothetical protein